MNEHAYIRTLKKRFPSQAYVKCGIGDDTAVLERNAREYELVTTDSIIEGVHFTRKKHTPFEIGWKALARSVSDVAAMGGVPRAAVVALACPKSLFADTKKTLNGIQTGLRAVSKKCACPIVGGDISRAKELMVTVTVTATVEKKRLVMRNGACTNDSILCTGRFGHSIEKKHVSFTPRIKEARFLTECARPTAMIDVSDGLLQDLGHILSSSQKGAVLFAGQIPFSSALTRAYSSERARLTHALCDGEDYELICTVPQRRVDSLFPLKKKAGIRTPLTVIGRITERKGIQIYNDKGDIIAYNIKGFDHFEK